MSLDLERGTAEGRPPKRDRGRPKGLWRAPAAVLGWALTVAATVAAEPPDAATLLRRADLVRNPFLGTVLEIDLSVVSRASGRELRRSTFVLLTHRNDRTLLLTSPADRSAPGAVLISEDIYWLLLPRAERPVALALRHVVAGDLSHAGFLRLNLRLRYEARDGGEETLDGVPCRRLELEPKDESVPFGRIRYWVARSGFLPIRIEFYSRAGDLLKTARFLSYQRTNVGPRPQRIEIEDAGRPRERATMTLGRPRGVPTARLNFNLDDLAALRAAARRWTIEREAAASGRELFEALLSAARSRAAASTAKLADPPP